jgi:hypothetical protein
MAVQVFQINDCDWWAGEGTSEDVLVAYCAATGCTPEDATQDEGLPVPLTDAQLDSCKLVLEDNEIITFRDYLEQLKLREVAFPCFFATTEW